MFFKTLKEKCEYYRKIVDYKLTPNSYVIAMVDGHCFSKMIKNKFNKPFDDDFIGMMNETAKYLCENIQGVKFAYVQSDEISLLITDFDTPTTDSFFSYRMCKMQSLIASMATAKFNQVWMKNIVSTPASQSDICEMVDDYKPCTFDCKVWNVPSYNEAYAWFLYRQTDCIKNSKAQTAQSCLSHKELVKLNCDEMIAKAKEIRGVDWYDFPDDRKYGRIIKKVQTPMEKELPSGEHINFTRNLWTPTSAVDFKVDGNSVMIKELIPQML